MSVEELKIGDTELISLHFKGMAVTIRDKNKVMAGLILDRNQAHLLMLYLQEHLK